jgi:hypothetical protein
LFTSSFLFTYYESMIVHSRYLIMSPVHPNNSLFTSLKKVKTEKTQHLLAMYFSFMWFQVPWPKSSEEHFFNVYLSAITYCLFNRNTIYIISMLNLPPILKFSLFHRLVQFWIMISGCCRNNHITPFEHKSKTSKFLIAKPLQAILADNVCCISNFIKYITSYSMSYLL